MVGRIYMKTRKLFAGRHYTACVLNGESLVVTRNRKRGGVQLVGPEASKWIEAIETALDSDEKHALCRAILNASA